MPDYTVVLSKKAEKFLDSLSTNLASPIIDALQNLELNPHPNGYIKMK